MISMNEWREVLSAAPLLVDIAEGARDLLEDVGVDALCSGMSITEYGCAGCPAHNLNRALEQLEGEMVPVCAECGQGAQTHSPLDGPWGCPEWTAEPRHPVAARTPKTTTRIDRVSVEGDGANDL